MSEYIQVLPVNGAAEDDQFERVAAEPFGHQSVEVGRFNVAQVLDHLFDDGVDPRMFTDDAADVVEQGVLRVGREHLLVLVLPAYQQSGCLKPVQLDPDRIGRFAELLLQSTEV